MSITTSVLTSPLLEAHMRFVCPECGLEHQTQPEWRKHLNEDHEYLTKSAEDLDFKAVDEHYHECRICKKWVANTQNGITLLQYHRFLHMPFSETYRCRHCAAAFTRKRALAEHLYRMHARYIKGPNTCTTALVTPHNDVLSKANRNPKENPEFYMRFICPQCGKTMELFQQWLDHLEKAHTSTSTDLRMHRLNKSKNNCCIICRKIFYTCEKPKLMRHRFTHLPYKLYFRCAFCPVKKAYKTEMLRHFIQVHKQEFLACRKYLKKPVEWGAVVPESLQREMDRLMRVTKDDNNDLIKKALMASLIDLEKETQEEGQQTVKNIIIDNVLNKNLKDLRAMMRTDSNEAQHSKASTIAERKEKQQHLGVEAFCQNVFDEIDDDQSTLKRDSSAQQQHQSSKIISLEIDKLNTRLASGNFIEQPPPKRIKLEHVDATEPLNDKQKAMLEPYICYLCPECGTEFSEQAAWRNHVFQQHNLNNVVEANFKLLQDKKSYLCLHCMDVLHTNKLSELQRHRFIHMPFQTYLKCTLCSTTISSKPKMLHHLRIQHGQQLMRPFEPSSVTTTRNSHLQCQNCNKLFRTHSAFQQHREICSQPAIESKKYRLYDIEKNSQLLESLCKSHDRIERYKAAWAQRNEH